MIKNITSETLELIAQIDCCYFLMEEAGKRTEKPITPFERMIDDATGYGKMRDDKLREYLIDLARQIIECKKKIGADYSCDEKFMSELINLGGGKMNCQHELSKRFFDKHGYKCLDCGEYVKTNETTT